MILIGILIYILSSLTITYTYKLFENLTIKFDLKTEAIYMMFVNMQNGILGMVPTGEAGRCSRN